MNEDDVIPQYFELTCRVQGMVPLRRQVDSCSVHGNPFQQVDGCPVDHLEAFFRESDARTSERLTEAARFMAEGGWHLCYATLPTATVDHHQYTVWLRYRYRLTGALLWLRDSDVRLSPPTPRPAELVPVPSIERRVRRAL